MNTPQPQEKAQESNQHILAVAHLNETADPANRVLLTEQALQVYYKGKGRAFSLGYLQGLALEHRKLWLPLIGGGILASLCALSLLHTFHMPYRLLTGVALGLLGVWWGYRGSMALVVYEQRHHTDFLISYLGQSLPVFVAFANRLIRHYPHSIGNYFIELSAQELEVLQQQGYLDVAEPRPCLPQEQAFSRQAALGSIRLGFDPYQMGPRLHWSLRGKELVAHLQGRISAHELELLA